MIVAMLCLASLLIGVPAAADAAVPRAAGGRLDLSHWNFTEEGIVPLDGEWELYWQALLDPEALRRPGAPAPSGLIEVPGSWDAFVPATGFAPVGGEGFATYRLIIKLPATALAREADPLAISIPYVNTSYRLWVDGRLAAENGSVATSRELAFPQILARVARFSPQGETAEIVLQVSNFHFRSGGVPLSLRLGLAEHIQGMERRREAMDAFLAGVTIFASLLYGALYAHRFENRAAAYFSLFLLVMTVRMAFTGNYLAYRIYPHIPWETGLKIEYITGYLSPPLLFLYLRAIFPEEASRLVVRASIALGLAGSLVVLLTPGRISSVLIPGYLVVLVLYVLYALFVAVQAAKRNREDARLFIVGAALFLVSVLATLVDYARPAWEYDAIPIGIAGIAVTQGWILARRFAQHMRAQERLVDANTEMLERARLQLAEAQEYRRLMAQREEELRSQIAEMLHGRTQGRLLAAMRQIRSAAEEIRHNPERAEQQLAEVERLLQQVREEDVREVGRRLHPSAVRAGLIPAFETLLQPMEDAYKVAFVVDRDVEILDSPEDLQFPYELRLGMYRILEEALNNVVRHADAKHVSVSIMLMPDPTGDRLLLTIEDDGKGCDPDQLTLGLGHQSIEARVGDLGGMWRFQSSPGSGTIVSVEVPLSWHVAEPFRSRTQPSGEADPAADQAPNSQESRTPDFPKSG